ncbi:unnamed protein product [Effrenium voratum]|nr:unnamed protein product [Effrenium voratum]
MADMLASAQQSFSTQDPASRRREQFTIACSLLKGTPSTQANTINIVFKYDVRGSKPKIRNGAHQSTAVWQKPPNGTGDELSGARPRVIGTMNSFYGLLCSDVSTNTNHKEWSRKISDVAHRILPVYNEERFAAEVCKNQHMELHEDVLVAFDGCKVGLAAVSDVEVWVFYLKRQKHRFRTRMAAFGSKNCDQNRGTAEGPEQQGSDSVNSRGRIEFPTWAVVEDARPNLLKELLLLEHPSLGSPKLRLGAAQKLISQLPEEDMASVAQIIPLALCKELAVKVLEASATQDAAGEEHSEKSFDPNIDLSKKCKWSLMRRFLKKLTSNEVKNLFDELGPRSKRSILTDIFDYQDPKDLELCAEMIFVIKVQSVGEFFAAMADLKGLELPALLQSQHAELLKRTLVTSIIHTSKALVWALVLLLLIEICPYGKDWQSECEPWHGKTGMKKKLATTRLWNMMAKSPENQRLLLNAWSLTKQEADQKFQRLVFEGIEPNPGPLPQDNKQPREEQSQTKKTKRQKLTVVSVNTGGAPQVWVAIDTFLSDQAVQVLAMQEAALSSKEYGAVQRHLHKKGYRTYYTPGKATPGRWESHKTVDHIYTNAINNTGKVKALSRKISDHKALQVQLKCDWAEETTEAIRQHWMEVWRKAKSLSPLTLQQQKALVAGNQPLQQQQHPGSSQEPQQTMSRPKVEEAVAAATRASGAAGTDQWHADEIRQLPKAAWEVFWNLTERWEVTGQLPEVLKEIRQINLTKPGKVNGDSIDSSSLRPISIYSHFWRLYTSTWARSDQVREWKITAQEPEVGGSKGQPGCENMAADALDEFHTMGYMGSLDYTQAFDHVNPKLAAWNMSRKGLHEGLCRVLENAWTDQRRFLAWDGHVNAEPMCTDWGVPQGDALSPTALTCLLSDGLKWVKTTADDTPGRARHFIYMDDRTWTASSSSKLLRVQEAWQTWSHLMGLRESPRKSQLTAMRPKQREELQKQAPDPSHVKASVEMLGTVTVGKMKRSSVEKETQRIQKGKTRIDRVGLLPVPRSVKYASIHTMATPVVTYGWVGVRQVMRMLDNASRCNGCDAVAVLNRFFFEYVFAVLFTQVVNDIIAEGEVVLSPAESELALNYFGSLTDSMLTLFLCISGGVSWELVLKPLRTLSGALVACLLIYVFFTYFCVLNVVTAVFCQSAIESAQNDQLTVIQAMLLNKEQHIQTKIQELFEKLGADESGVITLKIFQEHVNSPVVRAWFEALGLDVWDAMSFFKLLDSDGGGSVDVEEFFMGCLRFRGQARAMDVGKVIQDQASLMRQTGRFQHLMEVELRRLRRELRSLRGDGPKDQWEPNLWAGEGRMPLKHCPTTRRRRK